MKDQPEIMVETETTDPILNEKILVAIGKRLDPEKQLSSAIHNDIVLRWQDILKNGLPKEERIEIFKRHPMPENCVPFEAPKLNAEIKASLMDPLITRDGRIAEKQQEVAICLAGLGKLLAKLLKRQTTDTTRDTLAMISVLSDISRILVDLQRDETMTRRLIITANLNTTIKQTLNATSTDVAIW